MKVTIYDVAREAGLSIATVSRVINGKGGVTPKSEKKIRDAIARLGYLPDASAQGLASSLVNTIGFVLTGSVSANYYTQLLDGAGAAARARGFDILLLAPFGTPEEFVQHIRTRHKVDGVVFANYTDYVDAMYQSDVPMIYAGQRQKWDTQRINVYGGFSGYRKEAFSLLLNKGCKRLLFLDGGYIGDSSYYAGTSQRNRQVIEETIVTYGLDPGQIEYCSFRGGEEDKLYDRLRKKLSSPDHPDGIFCVLSELCPQLYTIVSQCGLSIPKDVKIVSSVHTDTEGALLRPALTAYRVNAWQMGYNAAVKLIQIIQGGVPDESLSYVPYSFLERESV